MRSALLVVVVGAHQSPTEGRLTSQRPSYPGGMGQANLGLSSVPRAEATCPAICSAAWPTLGPP